MSVTLEGHKVAAAMAVDKYGLRRAATERVTHAALAIPFSMTGSSSYRWPTGTRGDAPEWERVLWRPQPFPDNYVPPTFLSALSENRNILSLEIALTG